MNNNIVCSKCKEVAYVIYLRAIDRERPWTVYITIGMPEGEFAYVDEQPHCRHCDHVLADSWANVSEIWPIA